MASEREQVLMQCKGKAAGNGFEDVFGVVAHGTLSMGHVLPYLWILPRMKSKLSALQTSPLSAAPSVLVHSAGLFGPASSGAEKVEFNFY